MIYYPTEKNKPSDDSELWRSEKLILIMGKNYAI